jgi:hypothetical protein
LLADDRAAERFTALADAERMGFDEFLGYMLGVYEASRAAAPFSP